MNEPTNTPSGTLSSRIRRRLWVVVLCALIGAAFAYHHASSKAQRYQASAQLLFGTNVPVLTLLGLPSGANGLSGVTQATNASLAGLPVIGRMTRKELGAHVPPGGVNVITQTSGTTNLVAVVAQSVTPADAVAVANEYAKQVVVYQRQQQQLELEQAIQHGRTAKIHPKLGGGKLTPTLANMQTALAVNPVDVEVADSDHRTLVSRKTKTQALEGLLLGAIVGIIIALLLDWLDPKLRDITGREFHGLDVITLADLPNQGGYEATTAITRRLLGATAGREDLSPQLIAITSTGQAHDVQSARQLAAALTQTAAANGLSAAIVRVAKPSGESASGSAAELTRTKLADGVEATDVSPQSLLSGAAARDLEAELRDSYRVIVVIDERPSEFSPLAHLVKAADVSVLVVTLGKTNRRDAVAAAESLVHMEPANATLIAFPGGFRAAQLKSGALQPVS